MGGGWNDGGYRLHGLGGDAMNGLDHSILTLVTFAPAAGALLLLFAPRRDREIRVFAFLVSLFTFVLSLHLPAHFHKTVKTKSEARLVRGSQNLKQRGELAELALPTRPPASLWCGQALRRQ